MMRTVMLFSKAPKILWDWAFTYVCHVRRFLPTSANPGCHSPLQMLTGQKHTVLHLIPFGSLLFAHIAKDQTKDTKLEARAVRCIFIGFGVVADKKCVMAYTLNPSSPYKIGTVIDTVSYQSDPTYFPYRKGQERVLSLSGSTPTKKELQEYVQDFPIFHDQDEWKDALVELDSGPMFSSLNERKIESVSEDQDTNETDTTSEAKRNEEQKATLVAYDPASERYILKTS